MDVAASLTLLRLGDSAFPAGGFAFSWGLEGLVLDGLVTGADDLDELVHEQLVHRWNPMDRPLIARSFGAQDLDELTAVDRLAEAAAASAVMRDGSRRAGRSLLGTAARLGCPLASDYAALVKRDARLGHLAVVQGLVFRGGGLSIEAAQLLGGWTMINGLVGAGTRLGLVGYARAQGSLASASATIVEILAREPHPRDTVSSFTPLVDIAAARKPLRHTSLFAT